MRIKVSRLILIMFVAIMTIVVASCFAGTIQRHCFEAGVAFDADGRVVASTETLRGNDGRE